jgi:methylase of polypeptide subunit release factors
VVLELTEDSYPLEPSPEESWLPIAFRAFARIGAAAPVRDVLIIGTGNGVDALGAAEILDPRSLTVTDLFESGLAVSRANVEAHLDDGAIDLAFHAGDLLAGVPPDRLFDLVYENLPNIPARPGAQMARGTISGRFFEDDGLEVPSPYGEYLLALHHRFLGEVRERVRPGGGVLTALGGRVPDQVLLGLHRGLGYAPELAAFDLKVQVEPMLVVPGYAREEERTGVEFRYYDAEAVAVVAEARGEGLDGQELLDAVAARIETLAMTAREAERRALAGEAVAHSVLMIVGRPGAALPPT